MDARRGYRSRTSYTRTKAERERESGSRRRRVSKKRVARGKGAGIRQAPVHVPELVASSTVSPRRYLSHKQGGAAMVFSSRWSSDTMPPQPPPPPLPSVTVVHVPAVYTYMYMYIIYIVLRTIAVPCQPNSI